MATIRPLDAREVARRCDPAGLGFESTAALADLKEPLGQDRALDALRFAMDIPGIDYNVFAYGPPGLGRHLIVKRVLERHAAQAATPPDWCYVHDPRAPSRPLSLAVPAGRGAQLRDDLHHLIQGLERAIPTALESEELRLRKAAIDEEAKREHQADVDEVSAEAAKRGLLVIQGADGFGLVPAKDGEVISPEQFEKLPREDRERHASAVREMEKVLDAMVARLPTKQRARAAKLRAVIGDLTSRVVKEAVQEVRARWTDVPEVLAHLDRVEAELSANPDEVAAARMGNEEQRLEATRTLGRFQVNVLVERKPGAGAPVVYEDHPTYERLLGRVEHLSIQGTLVNDIKLIKAGALHRANGGFLVLDAARVLSEPLAWDALERALRAGAVTIDSFGRALGLSSTSSFDPAPIALSVRVVLLGSRRVHELLCAHDPEFLELFKVPAEFVEEVAWNAGTEARYAQLIATIVREESLPHLDAAAAARVIEEASRRAGDSQKLSVRMRELSELLREASHLAGRDAACIQAQHVERALEAKVHRADRARERTYELVRRRMLLIDVAGERVGQVNGLMVVALGGFAFGAPARITARTSVGNGHIVDIEREVELGGPIHSKGVLILQGFLRGRFALDQPLSLAASVVFEQSYGKVEGDSASCGELAALLSSIGQVPVSQALAVTGSVNQHGELQPVGGVDEKIEGYFDACREAGATDEQGVIIPAANVPNLMLRADVVAAVAAGTFRVFAARTIDEVMELLTALPAGERDEAGAYPPSSVNGRVEARLRALAISARRFARPASPREAAVQTTRAPE